MLTADDTIHGWSPAEDGDDVEVNVSQDMCFMAIGSSSSILSSTCPPLNTALPKILPLQPQSDPSVPSTGATTTTTTTTTAPSSDRRAQRNRNRDPSWIPRPRNAFIIFRCEYSREHAQSSQESQNDHDPNVAVKTLSKRAAEAWKKLSPSERERYKILADREREEHARLHPHYRFRPMKRQISGTGKSSRERSQSPEAVFVDVRPAQSAHFPSVLAAAPEKPRSRPSVERAEVAGPAPQAAAMLLPEPPIYSIDRALADPGMPFGVDYSDMMLFYPSPEATLPPESPPPSASVELCSPLQQSAVGVPPDAFHCNDSSFGLGLAHDELEQAQALEAYAIGLYNHDLFFPYSFPEYY